MPRAKVIDYWNSRADSYDSFYDATEARSQAVEALISGIQSLDGDRSRALDLGCGSARLTEAIAPLVREVIAVDISSEMIRIGQSRLADDHELSSKINWQVEDAVEFEPERKVDLCVSALLAHHLSSEDKLKLFNRCFEFLNPDGLLAFADQMICTPSLETEANLEGRRKQLRPFVERVFYPTGTPPTYSDKFEYTETDQELFVKIREAGFEFVGFQVLAPILGVFIARKNNTRRLLAAPHLKPALLPAGLEDRYEVLEQIDVDGWQRFRAVERRSDDLVRIDIARGKDWQRRAVADAIRALEKLGDRDWLAPVLERSAADADTLHIVTRLGAKDDPLQPLSKTIRSGMPLFTVLQLVHSLASLTKELHESSIYGGMDGGRVLIDGDGRPKLADLCNCRLRTEDSPEPDVGKEIRQLGSVLYSLLPRPGFGLRAKPIDEIEEYSDLLRELESDLPGVLLELCLDLLQSRRSAAHAEQRLASFLHLRRRELKRPEAVRAANREFISALEFETAPQDVLDRIWEECRDDEVLVEALHQAYREYASPHSTSNLLAMLAHHDYARFRDKTGKTLKRVKARSIGLNGIDFSGWLLDACDFKECRFDDCDFSSARWSRTQLARCTFEDCRFEELRGSGVYLVASAFSQSDLRNADLTHANLERVKLINCRVDGLDLTGSNLHTGQLEGGAGVALVRADHANTYGARLGHEWKERLDQSNTEEIEHYLPFEESYRELFADRWEAYWWLEIAGKGPDTE